MNKAEKKLLLLRYLEYLRNSKDSNQVIHHLQDIYGYMTFMDVVHVLDEIMEDLKC